MKSAFFLSHDDRFDEIVRDRLRAWGAHVGADVIQLRDDVAEGATFHYYGRVGAELEWEFREPPWTAMDGVTLPQMDVVTGYYVECRSESLLARTAQRLAAEVGSQIWVMDSDGAIWDASRVDPVRVSL